MTKQNSTVLLWAQGMISPAFDPTGMSHYVASYVMQEWVYCKSDANFNVA